MWSFWGEVWLRGRDPMPWSPVSRLSPKGGREVFDSRHLFNLGSCFSFFSGHQPLVLNLPSYLSVLQATAEVADNGDRAADKILPLVQ